MSLRLGTRTRHRAPSDDGPALALVDCALANASRREFFGRQEAAGIMHRVRASVHGSVLGPAVTSVVNDALVSYREDRLVDRGRVVDALLDVRLVLATSRDGSPRYQHDDEEAHHRALERSERS
jgi:hypothetical protein